MTNDSTEAQVPVNMASQPSGAMQNLHPAVKGVLAHFEADIDQAEEAHDNNGSRVHVHSDFSDFAHHFAVVYHRGAADLTDALRKLMDAKNAMLQAVRTHENAEKFISHAAEKLDSIPAPSPAPDSAGTTSVAMTPGPEALAYKGGTTGTFGTSS